MDSDFFEYVINDLICGYFREFHVEAGRRYYIVIEHDEYRAKFMSALKAAAVPCTVSGIYPSGTQSEDPYDTYQLELGRDYPAVLIGNDCDATEDYLTTMRNAVGVPGSRYANYCLLFVLANSSLSSIVTTCQNLQGVGAPLSADYIISKIRGKANESLPNDKEVVFLKVHLEEIARSIEDGVCSLFEFRHALAVLNKGSLKEHFADLEFFRDDSIYENLFSLSDADMQERVLENHRLFRQIGNILNDDDDTDKARTIGRILDDKLAKKLVDNDGWARTDWKAIQDSIERRNAPNKPEIKDISVWSETQKLPIAISQKAGRTKRHILVYGDSAVQDLTLQVRFNRKLKRDEVATPAFLQGDRLVMPLTHGSVLMTQAGGYEFVLRVIPCSERVFHDIESDFTLNKAGDIVVKVASDTDKITFGSGETVREWPDHRKGADADSVIRWENGIRIDVSLLADDEQDTLDLSLLFGLTEIPVQLKLNSSAALIAMAPADTHPFTSYWAETSAEGNAFGRIYDGEKLRVSRKRWRWYLENEKRFIDTGLPYLECTTTYVPGGEDPQREWLETPKLSLPESVENALTAIYAYFRQKNAAGPRYTTPSLISPDEELTALYEEYSRAVLDVLRKLPSTETRMLTPEEYNMTHLGVLKDHGDSRIYLSPFHPLMVVYQAEFWAQVSGDTPLSPEHLSLIRRQLTPSYLIPYLQLNDRVMRPVADERLSYVSAWCGYEESTERPQVHINAMTKKAVTDKMQEFIKHFPYLFQNVDCPIIIGAIGFEDDSEIVKGVIRFIVDEYRQRQVVQRIELHEYVGNLTKETFFEKLNRLNTTDAIMRELAAHGYTLKGTELSEQQLVHFFFTRVAFYKHRLDDEKPDISYCHVAFYRMLTTHTHVPLPHEVARSEMALNGLISATSTQYINQAYYIGFGTKGNELKQGKIYSMAAALNTLYANERIHGHSAYSLSVGMAKCYRFNQDDELLNNIYDKANWVTFINPEVDINFFYHQKLYIVHYTDQGSINAKYDSITVTKHIRQYENILHKSYAEYVPDAALFPVFNERMMNYFNCLNGSWMLSLVNKTEVQIREKMSIVAATIALSHFLHRVAEVIWVPISLEEVLRVTGAIRLPMDHIFSKKSLGASGTYSDDLLMMGLHLLPGGELRLYFYPVEVKCTRNNTAMVDRGGEQVSHTYQLFRQHLLEDEGFILRVYRTFFASVFLSNAEKLAANGLMSREDYEVIEGCRYRLLNSQYSIGLDLPRDNGDIGKAAVISFHNGDVPDISTVLVEGVPVCEIHFSEKACYRFVAEPESAQLRCLDSAEIEESAAASAAEMENEVVHGVEAPQKVTQETGARPVPAAEEKKKQPEPESRAASPQSPSPAADAETIRILLGHEMSGNHSIVFEPANTRMVSHPNMGIIGTMGTGKTQFARSFIAQLSKESCRNVGATPIGVLIFDYKGDYKDKDFLEATGGEAYKYNFPFNPLKLIIMEEDEGMNLPAITADRISDAFTKAYALGPKQKSLIKQTIIATYEDAGITRDPKTWHKPAPTMAQVIEKYFSLYDANDKSYALFDKLNDYAIFTENNEQCVSLFEWLDRVRVIDLTRYPDETKKVIVSLILDLFYAEMCRMGASRQQNGYRELRAMIMVDEAHQFLKKDFSSLRRIISEGRMFGVGMILSTQNIGDFKSAEEDYSQFILSWVIHHVNSISRAELSGIFGANDPYADTYSTLINKAGLFESVCKIGNRVESMKDFPFFRLVEEDARFKNNS